MNWPLEPEGIARFAKGLDEILVVEEKRGLVEDQLREQLFNRRDGRWPLVYGKKDDRGQTLVPSTAELSPSIVAKAIARRLSRIDGLAEFAERVARIEEQEQATDDHLPADRLSSECH